MRRTSGFSLIEVLCSVVILGVGLIGLTEGITTALRSSKESEHQTTAALLAAGRIEFLRADGYIIDGKEEGEGGEGFALYRWRQEVSKAAIDGLHDVVVVVENAKTGEAIYELRTQLFDPPPSREDEQTKNGKDSSKTNRRERRGR